MLVLEEEPADGGVRPMRDDVSSSLSWMLLMSAC